MSNLPKVLVAIALSVIAGSAMADWQADAAHLSSEAGIDTKSAIDTFKNDIDKFKPPPPCIDKNPETFTLGSPATLACGGGSPSGGGAPGGLGGTGGVIEQDQQQKGSGESFDHM